MDNPLIPAGDMPGQQNAHQQQGGKKGGGGPKKEKEAVNQVIGEQPRTPQPPADFIDDDERQNEGQTL